MSCLRLLLGCIVALTLFGATTQAQAPKASADLDRETLQRLIPNNRPVVVHYKLGESGKVQALSDAYVTGVIELFGKRFLMLRRVSGDYSERVLVRCDAIVTLVISETNPRKTAGETGTTKTKKTPTLPDDVFRITATEVRLPRGGAAPLRIVVNRGVNFRQEIILTVQTPKGVTVAPVAQTLGQDTREAVVTLRADSYVPPGMLTVEVVASPERGAPARLKVPVEVVTE